VVYEVGMIASALTMVVVLWRRWWHAERSAEGLRDVLETHQAEREAWRQSATAAIEGLSRAIDQRLRSWGLTPTECEVALLILKGESHKRIAFLTGRSERTVRQHAVTIYSKSGLRGRAELAAFFLQDLVLPPTEDREP
jgi:DNA-binding NarL/FixJ family response regulator